MASRRGSGGRGGQAALIVACVLFIGAGAYYVWRGIDAALAGTMISGGPRLGTMSGSTAIIVGLCAASAGLFGLWLIVRVARKGRRRGS